MKKIVYNVLVRKMGCEFSILKTTFKPELAKFEARLFLEDNLSKTNYTSKTKMFFLNVLEEQEEVYVSGVCEVAILKSELDE
ncbi:MAG: hypothetical protein ACRCX2_09330 [Paraclostridium sp.]